MTNQIHINDKMFIRQEVDFDVEDPDRAKVLRDIQEQHRQNPTSVEVQISINQLDFIKRCIVEATSINPILAAELD